MKTKLSVCVSILTAALAFLPLSATLQAEEGLSIISYRVQPHRFLSTDFCKRLTDLPEWEPFFTTFTGACDKALSKELSQDRLDGKLPDKIVGDLQKVVDRGISTRQALEAFFGHVETIVFELQAEIGTIELEDGLDGIAKLLNGKIDVNVSGVLGTIIDVNPRKVLPVLKYLKEGKEYEFLKNEPEDGDFIVKFNFRFHEHIIKFCMAGVKLPGENRYALILSGKHDIKDYCKAFAGGKFDVPNDSATVKEVVLSEPCFLFMDQQRKKSGLNSNEADFLGKIKQMKAGFRDFDGASQIDLRIVMRTEADAQAMRNLFAGLVALVQLTQEPGSQVMKLLESVHTAVEGENVVVAAKLDNPELWKVIASVLEKATGEITPLRVKFEP